MNHYNVSLILLLSVQLSCLSNLKQKEETKNKEKFSKLFNIEQTKKYSRVPRTEKFRRWIEEKVRLVQNSKDYKKTIDEIFSQMSPEELNFM